MKNTIQNTKKKLSLIQSTSIYVDDNWERFKAYIVPFKGLVLDGKIKLLETKYGSSFAETYRPLTKHEGTWGSNLDYYNISISSKNIIEIIHKRKEYHFVSNFQWSIKFKLTDKEIHNYFSSYIDFEFCNYCEDVFNDEEEKRKQKAIDQIKLRLLEC